MRVIFRIDLPVAACLFFLGCGGGSGSPQAPAPPPSAAATLNINNNWLPGGVPGQVRVFNDKGYEHACSATTSLTGLPAGTYTIVPSSVMDGSVLYQPTGTQEIALTADMTANVTITYFVGQTRNLGGIELVAIPAATFTQGSADLSDTGAQPPRPVAITAFYMARYPITQAQWVAKTGSNPSRFPGDNTRPVDSVSYDDITNAGGFLEQLNAATAISRPLGLIFRLPTEAEWEYACRARSTTSHFFGNAPTWGNQYAWGTANAGTTTHGVGGKLPNAYGLYDMAGNVWEWCQDRYAPYTPAPQLDPPGPMTGTDRVLRGGSSFTSTCRSAMRFHLPSASKYNDTGFRVVLAEPATRASTYALPGGVYLPMVAVPSGTFTQGDLKYSRPYPRKVTITQDFSMAKYLTTQGQWRALMDGADPSKWRSSDTSQPVEQVSFLDITRAGGFLDKLNAATVATRPAGRVFRLPTEAEWEMACKAGTETAYYFGDEQAGLWDNAWFAQNAGEFAHPVGLKLPNPLGLYDMLGNLNEWCQDWDDNLEPWNDMTDPVGPATGTIRILRGGSYEYMNFELYSHSYGGLAPGERHSSVGFRVVLGRPLP